MLTGTDPPKVVAWASSTKDRLWAELEAVLRHRTTEAAPRLELFEIRAWGLPLDSTVSAYVRFEWLNAEPAAPPPTSALLVAGGEEGWHARRHKGGNPLGAKARSPPKGWEHPQGVAALCLGFLSAENVRPGFR